MPKPLDQQLHLGKTTEINFTFYKLICDYSKKFYNLRFNMKLRKTHYFSFESTSLPKIYEDIKHIIGKNSKNHFLKT